MTEFIEMKTSALTGEALNWAVAKARKVPVIVERGGRYGEPDSLWFVSFCGHRFNPVGDWARGGPLIDEYRVGFRAYSDAIFSVVGVPDFSGAESGETHLAAVCRAVTYAHLGDTVLVPAELVAA